MRPVRELRGSDAKVALMAEACCFAVAADMVRGLERRDSGEVGEGSAVGCWTGRYLVLVVWVGVR